ncbi:unnamed protein product [Pocillopora meandrina]|uniref:Uncharacterized protein n=1 Tax=Pocillopora meandrina TaxID=46732 RepID=A0AAU9X067_9CNID|nr:unnamed protein product [Pocillopora meandrina]
MKTYRQFPGKAWLHYDTAFWKDAPASGLADWSCKNLNLYNFHTCLVPQSQPSAASSPFPNSGSLSSNFCRSRSDSICHWLFGRCRYCHFCDKCEGDHPSINCPFRALPSGSLLAAHHSFAFAASHTASRDNFIADALSHFDFQGFHCLATHAAPVATSVLHNLCHPFLTASEQTVMYFCAYLADCLHHSFY